MNRDRDLFVFGVWLAFMAFAAAVAIVAVVTA